MDWIFIGISNLLVFVLGAAIGSFLNVVIYRLPAGLSLLHPPSRCPNCRRSLKAYDNVPVFGWLWLRGRCRFCGWPIPIRYPLVEATTGGLFLIVFWLFGVSWLTLGYWLLLSWLLALSLIDLDTMTLPNALTQSGLIVGLSFQFGLGVIREGALSQGIHQLMMGIIGAVLGIWLFDAITIAGSLLLGQTAMGGGDAKLAALMGAWLGWKLLLVAGFLACVFGTLIGGGAIALGLRSRRQPMPFGPFLALGTLVAAFWGELLLRGYMQLFFPTL